MLNPNMIVEEENLNSEEELLEAAEGGDIERVRALIEDNVNLDVRDESNSTPLHLAVQNGHYEIVVMLVEANADMTAMGTEMGDTPLHCAVNKGYKNIAEFLLNRGLPVDIRNGDDAFTPLHIAIADDQVECVELLISRGANVNLTCGDGSALDLALVYGSHHALEYLLKTNLVDPNFLQQDETPLLWLVNGYQTPENDNKILRVLLENGANVNVKDQTGQTALHIAAADGNLEYISILLDHNASADTQDNNGRTPVDVAKQQQQHDAAKFILDHNKTRILEKIWELQEESEYQSYIQWLPNEMIEEVVLLVSPDMRFNTAFSALTPTSPAEQQPCSSSSHRHEKRERSDSDNDGNDERPVKRQRLSM